MLLKDASGIKTNSLEFTLKHWCVLQMYTQYFPSYVEKITGILLLGFRPTTYSVQFWHFMLNMNQFLRFYYFFILPVGHITPQFLNLKISNNFSVALSISSTQTIPAIILFLNGVKALYKCNAPYFWPRGGAINSILITSGGTRDSPCTN